MSDLPDFFPKTIIGAQSQYHHIAQNQGQLILTELSRFFQDLTALKEPYEQLLDLTIIDKLHYGKSSWPTTTTSAHGYNRASAAFWEQQSSQAFQEGRFDWIALLRSYQFNHVLQVQCAIPASLEIPSIVSIWPGANWYEREAYDLFGIVFQNHPDLRRILSDYGFATHPLRKDYPMMGHEELRYDGAQGQCVYEPHTEKSRITIPKVIRKAGGSHA